MEQLLLQEGTRRRLAQLVESGAHAVLLIGLPGAGKETIASALAQELLGEKSLDIQPYFKRVSAHGSAVSIEQIRELHSFLQLKTTGTNNVRRVVVISGADTMTDEAQNALLKALEEPPLDTVLILTATRLTKIKQTILSRTQKVTIERISLGSARAYFGDKHSDKDITWAHVLSDGQVGLMIGLLQGKDGHVIAEQIDIAKQLFAATAFERLCRVDELSKAKDTLSDLLYACKRICVSALESAAAKAADQQTRAWHRRLGLVCEAEESLQSNVNTKLLLTDLFVHL